jgi:hypothetical protein
LGDGKVDEVDLGGRGGRRRRDVRFGTRAMGNLMMLETKGIAGRYAVQSESDASRVQE